MHRPSLLRRCLPLALLACFTFASEARGQAVGIRITLQQITFFDLDQYRVIATVTPPGTYFPLGDCVVTADGTLGYVSIADGRILVYDLTLDPPALASGTNVIGVPSKSVDIALSADDKFMVVTGRDAVLGGVFPLTVVNLETRTVADTYSPPVQTHWGAAFGPDGSILYCSANFVGRLTVDSNGLITDTGETFKPLPGGAFLTQASNLEIAPDGKSAVGIFNDFFAAPAWLVTFKVPGLTEISRERLRHPFGSWVQFSPSGQRLFAASTAGAAPGAGLYAFEHAQGAGLIVRPLWIVPGPTQSSKWGEDKLALDSTGIRLFTEVNNNMVVRDARHGSQLASFPLPPSASGPQSIAVPR